MDKTKIAVNVFDKLATLYQQKFMDVNAYADTFDFFCDAVKKKNAEILELACGPGNITKYLLNKHPDLKLLGIDLAPNMLALAKANNPSAEFQLMDCRNIGTISKKYDAVMCGFCLPYLSKEETEILIADVSKLLNPEGIFYISTMEDDYSKSGFQKGSTGDVVYQYFYKGDYLVSILEENKFKILTAERKRYPAQDGSEITDVILIASQSFANN